MLKSRFTHWLLLVALCTALITGCGAHGKWAETQSNQNTEQASAQVADSEWEDEDDKDPWERFNRSVFKFNQKLDKAVLRPVAKGYVKVTPKPVQKGVRNFFSNLREPTTIVNDFLQGKFGQGIKDTARFVVNSTVGVLGIFDVAKHLDLKKNNEDFGQTFAKWGIPSGPFIMLPIFGPSNARDATGLIPEYLYTDPIQEISDSGAQFVFRFVRAVDSRATLLRIDNLLEDQLDPYIFLRETYRQRRANLIHDGNPPVEDELDELLDEN